MKELRFKAADRVWRIAFAFDPEQKAILRTATLLLAALVLISSICNPSTAQTNPAGHASWITTSNNYTNLLFAVELKHHPEEGSQEGLSEYDGQVSQPTLADEDRERQENEAVLAQLKAAVPQQSQKEVAQDLQIVIRRVELDFRQSDYRRGGLYSRPTQDGIELITA
jgi:hypothetical protein